MRPAELPPPDSQAAAASEALRARIDAAIAQAGGWIGFDRYMHEALYAPGLGYYAGGARKFGAGGDFVTAPETSPLFASCLAAQCMQWFDQVPACVVEFGAGSGALAAQLIEAFARGGLERVRYRIVEVSAELRARQRETIHAVAPGADVQWLDAWPDRIEGVVLGNELLDAMPARAFRQLGETCLERGVVRTEAGLAWGERVADARLQAQVAARAQGAGWPLDYASEIGEQAHAWVAEAASRISRGALLLLDYGFPAREFYHPQRDGGTLMCHYRHLVHGDPLVLPGLQDITVHVDFSAVSQAACGAGMTLLGYTSQANFLLNLGLLDRLAEIADPGDPAFARHAQGVQVLLSEAEMGELFKAIAFGRGVGEDAAGFQRGDRSGAL
jgi:SAM-dependent MidA family methyltransferase